MKRLLTLTLIMILCLSLLASCNQQIDEPLPQTSDESSATPSNEPATNEEPATGEAPATGETPATGEAPVTSEESATSEEPTTDSTAPSDDTPMIMQYGFYSIEDFKTFYLTGSTDLSLYDTPPRDGFFPLFQMQEGCFVDLSDLFPTLNFENLTVSSVSVSWKNRYSYAAKTKDTKVSLSVSIQYKNAYENASIDSVLAGRDNSKVNKIIRSDYYTATEKPSKTSGLMLYIFELNDCIISYNFYNEIMQGMSIYKGNFTIGITTAIDYIEDGSFFNDETLKPATCLFKNGEARLNALNRIAEFIDSKPLIGAEPDSTDIPNSPFDNPSATSEQPATSADPTPATSAEPTPATSVHTTATTEAAIAVTSVSSPVATTEPTPVTPPATSEQLATTPIPETSAPAEIDTSEPPRSDLPESGTQATEYQLPPESTEQPALTLSPQ